MKLCLCRIALIEDLRAVYFSFYYEATILSRQQINSDQSFSCRELLIQSEFQVASLWYGNLLWKTIRLNFVFRFLAAHVIHFVKDCSIGYAIAMMNLRY